MLNLNLQNLVRLKDASNFIHPPRSGASWAYTIFSRMTQKYFNQRNISLTEDDLYNSKLSKVSLKKIFSFFHISENIQENHSLKITLQFISNPSVASRPKMIAVNRYGHTKKMSPKMIKRGFFHKFLN